MRVVAGEVPSLAGVPGVSEVVVVDGHLRCQQLEGDARPSWRLIAGSPVTDLTIEPARLEEAFLAVLRRRGGAPHRGGGRRGRQPPGPEWRTDERDPPPPDPRCHRWRLAGRWPPACHVGVPAPGPSTRRSAPTSGSWSRRLLQPDLFDAFGGLRRRQRSSTLTARSPSASCTRSRSPRRDPGDRGHRLPPCRGAPARHAQVLSPARSAAPRLRTALVADAGVRPRGPRREPCRRRRGGGPLRRRRRAGAGPPAAGVGERRPPLRRPRNAGAGRLVSSTGSPSALASDLAFAIVSYAVELLGALWPAWPAAAVVALPLLPAGEDPRWRREPLRTPLSWPGWRGRASPTAVALPPRLTARAERGRGAAQRPPPRECYGRR